MLNYVAAQIVLFGLRSDFLRKEGSPEPISKVLSDFVRIPQIFDLPAIRLHWGFVVALLMAVVVSWFLFKTTKGYELRAAGFNLHAARYAGMSASGAIILAMTLSGGLAGLGGSMEVLGTVPQMSNGISSGLRLQRDRPRAPRRQPARRHRGGLAAVRRPAHRWRADAGQDRHPARPAVLHPGARDHVRGGARAHPGALPVRSHAHAGRRRRQPSEGGAA